jgi:hypothetical protein
MPGSKLQLRPRFQMSKSWWLGSQRPRSLVGYQDNIDDRWVWSSEPVQVGSAAEEQERAEIVTHVREDFSKALAWFERVVATPG